MSLARETYNYISFIEELLIKSSPQDQSLDEGIEATTNHSEEELYTKSCRVVIAGAGTGSYKNTTLAVIEAIIKSDVILYDNLINRRLLSFARPNTKKIFSGKVYGKSSNQQAKITRCLLEEARKGLKVLRLKGGDAITFSRIWEEITALKSSGISYKILPGISSAQVAATTLKIPFSKRGNNHEITLVTGHDLTSKLPNLNWQFLAQSKSLILFMASNKIKDIARKFISLGRANNTKLVIVAKMGMIDQEIIITNLKDIITISQIPRPAIILMGNIVDELD